MIRAAGGAVLEAGIAPALLADVGCLGAVRVEYSVPEGLHREILFVHDLWLPPDFTPSPDPAKGNSIFWMLAECCREFGLPFDLMIGVVTDASTNKPVAGALIIATQGTMDTSLMFAVLVLIYPIWETVFSMIRMDAASTIVPSTFTDPTPCASAGR